MDDIFSAYDMLKVMYELGAIRYLDYAFAMFIRREESSEERHIISSLAGLLSCSTTRANNVCLDLNDPLGFFATLGLDFTPETEDAFTAVCNDMSLLLDGCNFTELFTDSSTVTVAGSEETGISSKPLVFSRGRLYLKQYYEAEEIIVATIKSRVAQAVSELPPVLFSNLESVYSRFVDSRSWGQKIAVFTALRSQFALITGGPGTGKTTVVAILLALYFSVHGAARVALVAPTGKAQARLKEAVYAELERLNISQEAKECFRRITFKTIHSLLGLGRNRSVEDRIKLGFDLIIVDEASMVSVLLFRRLFEAVPPSAKLLLLGDRDQLAAVEGGAVLSDLYNSVSRPQRFSAQYQRDFIRAFSDAAEVPEVSAAPALLQDVLAPLEYTFRFSAQSGIGRLKDLLSAGDQNELRTFLASDLPSYSSSLALHQFSSYIPAVRERELLRFISEWKNGGERYLAYLECATVAEAFVHFSRFQIITVLNNGSLSVSGINRLLLQLLGMHEDGCPGLPVMVEKNDYRNQIFNGDVGMFWPDSQGELKVWFPALSAAAETEVPGFRSFSPAKIPLFSPAFAMTIHKAQGSGFDSVLLVLPNVATEILTRELLYTAVTRAKDKIDIFGDEKVIVTSALKKVCRVSGLGEKLIR